MNLYIDMLNSVFFLSNSYIISKETTHNETSLSNAWANSFLFSSPRIAFSPKIWPLDKIEVIISSPSSVRYPILILPELTKKLC